ncbi:helicase-related protein [Dielma fastidiosa]|uniref:helicase-related protein n=1 Tax=Dielma fastidiosa TaxID=1034346 RepID=UPI0035685E23
MRCERCQNTDPKYFYNDNGTYYCRRCIAFGRLDVGIVPKAYTYVPKRHRCNYDLEFQLTDQQLKASKEIVAHLAAGYDVLVYAACGAGKTELTMEPLKQALNAGKKVGIAISRRQVVLEIAQRMQRAFKTLKVVPVCQGFTEITEGDLIVCTMHQLYRYHQAFDLLVMDEVDAFPYKGNELLAAVARNSCKGRILYLTATPDSAMLKEVSEGRLKMVELFQRPHGHPLVLPLIKQLPVPLQLVSLLMIMRQQKKPMLIFVPTIDLAQRYGLLFSPLFHCAALTSKTIEKDQIISRLRKRELDFIFTTTILERGITIPSVDVVVLQSDHPVFDEASLIQIIGRVGRSRDCPSGMGVFYCIRKTTAIKRCVRALEKMNETLVSNLF